MPHRGKARARRVAACALAVAAVATTAGPAASQTGGVRLDVRLGYDGVTRAYAANPVEILIDADTIFAGAIEVLTPTDAGLVTYEVPIEVPSGSRKVVRLVSPRASIEEIRAVTTGGDVVARVLGSHGIELARGEGLVGVVSPDPPPTSGVDMPITGEPVRVVPVPLEFLDLGEPGLEPLSHLVVDGAAVSRLSERQRAAILGFATGGGELIVAAASEADISFLPGRWRGAGGGSIRRARAGAGDVTVALAPLRDAGWLEDGDLWERTLRPSDVLRWHAEGSGGQQWVQALGESGGLRRTSLGWLLAFILIYVLLVAPVNFVVLARLRRRELAWVTIPALAVAFAGAAWLIGNSARDVPLTNGVAVVEMRPDGERVFAALATLSRGGGEESVAVDGGWIVEPLADIGGYNTRSRVRLGVDTATIRYQLNVGSIGASWVRRARVADGPDPSRLTWDGTAIAGRIANQTPFTLTRVGLFVGGTYASVAPTLEPGARSEVSNVGTPHARFDLPPEYYADYFTYGSGGAFGSAYRSPPINLFSRAHQLAGVGRAGGAMVVGMADLREVSQRLGLPPAVGEALVVIPVEVAYGGDVPEGATAADIVATDGEPQPGDVYGGFPSETASIVNGRDFTFRFRLPAGGRPASLRIRANPNTQYGPPVVVSKRGSTLLGPGSNPQQGAARVWLYDHLSRAWTPVAADGKGVVNVRAGSFLSDDGEVYLRVRTGYANVLTPASFLLRGWNA